MNDIRLKEIPFVFEGRTYILRCNMNVLADVQAAYGGDLSPALSGRGTMRSVMEFLAAMMNDYADEQGWFNPDAVTGVPILQASFTARKLVPILQASFTARKLGRNLRREDIPMAKILALVTAAITPIKKETSVPASGNPGN